MLTALLTFLGGTTARYLLEAMFGWLNKRQDAQNERELLRLQMELAEKRAAMQLEQTRLDGDLRISLAELQGWIESQRAASVLTGIRWIDGLNQSVRPTVAYLLVLGYLGNKLWLGLPWDEFDQGMLGSCLGWFYGDRSLLKRPVT